MKYNKPMQIFPSYLKYMTKPYTVIEDTFPVREYGSMNIYPDNSIKHRDKTLLASPVLFILAWLHPGNWNESHGPLCMAKGLILVEVPGDKKDAARRFERHGLFTATSRCSYVPQGTRLFLNWFRSWENMSLRSGALFGAMHELPLQQTPFPIQCGFFDVWGLT
ncbi:hypothetical protein P171DRAFT_440620 [Karstenula rhodostoma CBS 690.94]|uniref:Uncharacterized protein n=1 Tax=Karstenula rhodostoma CBS 690.94 TaxID=1392251 RepID=A0A9P4UG59_9PLEO|nr:hypothetical protein P171DRAFT_440620 [Karstenula rhodostoma CBS 690.94]